MLKNEETGKPITGKDEFDDPLGGPTFYNMWTILDREVLEGTLSTATGKVFPDISEQFPEAAEIIF